MSKKKRKKTTSPTLLKKKKVNRKRKKKKTYFWLYMYLFLFILALITFGLYLCCPIPSIFVVDKIYISEDNKLNLNFFVLGNKKENVYCMFNTTGVLPDKNDPNWMLSNEGTCSTTLDDNVYYAYLKDSTNKIIQIEDTTKYGKLINININKDTVYLAINGSYDLNVIYEKIGFVDDTITWTVSDNSISSIDENGIVTGIKAGNTTVTATINDKSTTSSIIVTDLITSNISKNSYDFNKPELECNEYTEKENDLLDKILEDRINDVGYQTRAAAVEAARFLVLEFPYRINYFFENGRISINNIDGEGRYFHKGLYLDESRYSSLKKSANGPKTWGCSLYSVQTHEKSNNGLNCSGFVSWSLVNAGFEINDVGARIISSQDITDYGKLTSFTENIIKEGKVKVGDLVHSEHTGGHIGIIIGIDEENIYVAHALWKSASKKLTKRSTNIPGVQITKYTHKEIGSIFPHVVLMDDFYKEDGNLTNMW